jgi:hypothetical protein
VNQEQESLTMQYQSALTVVLVAMATTAAAETSDLAQQLSNPVASLISVPLQFNIDSGIGPGEGTRNLLNIQPVLPFSIGSEWNLISRTIVPLIALEGIVPGQDETGMGNILQSVFLSPKAPTAGGLIWGAGAVVCVPTATNDLGPDQWAAGPTAVALRVSGPVTVGVLANHLWSLDNEDRFGRQSASFVQPFVSYTTPGATSFTLNSESTYDWITGEWSVPVNVVVSQLVPVFGQPVSFGAGIRYWAEAPEGGPEGWGLRAAVTYVFPK